MLRGLIFIEEQQLAEGRQRWTLGPLISEVSLQAGQRRPSTISIRIHVTEARPVLTPKHQSGLRWIGAQSMVRRKGGEDVHRPIGDRERRHDRLVLSRWRNRPAALESGIDPATFSQHAEKPQSQR